MDILKTIEKKAKKKQVKVVICEGWDERCIEATAIILKEKLAQIVLLGDPETIKRKAKALKADISNAEIVDYKNSILKKELTEKLVEVRKHKGMTKEEAHKLIEDENYFACLYALCGYADAVAGSKICPTAALMRPVLQILREQGKLVSEVSLVSIKEKNYFLSDLSLNIEPSAEDMASITLNAIDVAKMFDIEPKVALLSFSTKGSGGNTPQIEAIREAVAIVKKHDKKVIVDGELQGDAALDPYAAKRKCSDSPLKGEANTLIFPNLTAANIAAHLLGQFAGMQFTTAVLSGLQKPVAILGRSTPTSAVRNMVAGLAMQVNSK